MSWEQTKKPANKSRLSRQSSEVSLASTRVSDTTQPSQLPTGRTGASTGASRSSDRNDSDGPSMAKFNSVRQGNRSGSLDSQRQEELQDFDLGTFFNMAEWYGDDPYMTMCLSLFEKAESGTVLRSANMVKVLTRMHKDAGYVDDSTMDARDDLVSNHVVFNLPTYDEDAAGGFNWDRILYKLPIDRDRPSRDARVSLLKYMDPGNTGKMSVDELILGLLRVVRMPGVDSPEEMLDECVRHSQTAVQDLMLDGNPRKDDDVLVKEFRVFLTMLQGYMDLWEIFYEVDNSGDEMVGLPEFVAAAPKLKEWGMKDPALAKNPEHVFSQIDKDDSGYVTFGEFADFCVRNGLMEEVAMQFSQEAGKK